VRTRTGQAGPGADDLCMPPPRLSKDGLRLRSPLVRFGARLAISMLLALTGAGAVAYGLVSHSLERETINREAAIHTGDAQALADAVKGPRGPDKWVAEVRERLEIMQQRPGTLEAIVVDPHFRIVAAGKPGLTDQVYGSPRLAEVLSGGPAWAGHEAGRRRSGSDFEFIQSVQLPGGRYAFEITTKGSQFEQELAAIRHDLLAAGMIAWLGAALIFWLTGGRGLFRAHRYALERATRDGLTDLGNHRAFQTELPRAVEMAERYGAPLTLITLDLDGFKFANDRYGHRHGDRCLKEAARLLAGGRGGDQAFRVGGDEFILVLPSTDADGARRVAERVRRQLGEEDLSASLGIAQLHPGQSPADLRAEADAALYEAKRLGGDRAVAFAEIAARVSIMTSAQGAALDALLADRGLDVAFQPIWDLRRDEILGYEALARPHERYGFNGPAQAFDVAEQLGRMQELDVLCAERILARAGEVPSGRLLFLNLTPQALGTDDDGEPWLAEAVSAAGIAPERIVVEVTERVGSRMNRVIQTLQRLAELGFGIAIDDIGTGNSGLQMLRESGADYIKIDRSVVVGALTDPNARGVLVAMAAFAHATGSFVIAEGIEDEDVLRFVMALEIDSKVATINGGQGYHLGRPAPEVPPEVRQVAPAPVPELLPV
jgi:diguanylate cyclase (GGDEF)-like protein